MLLYGVARSPDDLGRGLGTTASSSDGNDSPPLRYGAASTRRRFRGSCLGLVGDQFAQERNQHDERNTDREAADTKLREQLRVPGIGSDRRGAGRFGDHAREVARKQ